LEAQKIMANLDHSIAGILVGVVIVSCRLVVLGNEIINFDVINVKKHWLDHKI
jgi:hypothetical protein